MTAAEQLIDRDAARAMVDRAVVGFFRFVKVHIRLEFRQR